MSQIEMKDGEFTIDDKRFYVGAVVKSACPKCGKVIEHDLSTHHYLSYPVVNRQFNYGMYCGDCDEEWNVPVILLVKLELSGVSV